MGMYTRPFLARDWETIIISFLFQKKKAKRKTVTVMMAAALKSTRLQKREGGELKILLLKT